MTPAATSATPVDTGALTREQARDLLRRFRFVTVYLDDQASYGLALTTDRELAVEVGTFPCRRASGVLEYEFQFRNELVPAALDVMRERGQI